MPRFFGRQHSRSAHGSSQRHQREGALHSSRRQTRQFTRLPQTKQSQHNPGQQHVGQAGHSHASHSSGGGFWSGLHIIPG